MRKSVILLVLVLLMVFSIVVSYEVTHQHMFTVLHPAGSIALQERNLIAIATVLMLGLAFPVLGVAFFVAWKYREDNKKATYTPDAKTNPIAATIFWSILSLYVVIMSVITWTSAHALDVYKPIASKVKPITVQVVALRWKWLFIYPDQQIATVNFLELPVNTPIDFKLTADAPMNSFWIPSLGGQIYSMSAMETQTHFIADKVGDFRGEESEINGSGYADMIFAVKVRSQKDFEAWVAKTKTAKKTLTMDEYNRLVKPSEAVPASYYASYDQTLYNTILMKGMTPTITTTKTKNDEMTMQDGEKMNAQDMQMK